MKVSSEEKKISLLKNLLNHLSFENNGPLPRELSKKMPLGVNVKILLMFGQIQKVLSIFICAAASSEK